jgi:hypothetical protein
MTLGMDDLWSVWHYLSLIVHALLATQDSWDFQLSSLRSLMHEHPTEWPPFQVGVFEVLDLLARPRQGACKNRFLAVC